MRLRKPPVFICLDYHCRPMHAPVVTRHRRPFLAPFWVMWLLFFFVLAAAFGGYRAATTTTIVLVRHAEKEMSTIADSAVGGCWRTSC